MFLSSLLKRNCSVKENVEIIEKLFRIKSAYTDTLFMKTILQNTAEDESNLIRNKQFALIVCQ